MAQAFTPWRTNEYPASDAPLDLAWMGGPQPYWRDAMDLRRSGWRSTPEAQYPDGYLGTVHSRREDRLLDGLKARQAQRPYSRGIHKGERRDSRDYFWPDEFNPESGLMMQAMAIETWEGYVVPRYASPGLSYDPLAPDVAAPPPARGPRGTPGAAVAPVPPSSERATSLQRLAPPWGTPDMPVVAHNAMRY